MVSGPFETMAEKPTASDFIELVKLIRLCGQTLKLFNAYSKTFGSSRIYDIADAIEYAALELLHVAESDALFGPIICHDDPQHRQIHGFSITDSAGNFLYADRRYLEIVGYELDQLAKTHIINVTHELDRDKNARLLNLLLRNGRPFEIKKRYVRPDASVIWVRNAVYRLEGSAEPLLLAICAPLLETETANPLLA